MQIDVRFPQAGSLEGAVVEQLWDPCPGLGGPIYVLARIPGSLGSRQV
jgi:hypothetical protein